MNLLEVKDLEVRFFTRHGVVHAVNGVSFSVKEGETLGLVGESGCGKSVTAFSIIRLVDKPGKITKGTISFKDRNLLSLTEGQMRELRCNEIALIMQDPLAALDPVFTIQSQMEEPLVAHTNLDPKERKGKIIELMKEVWIPAPETRIHNYPFQFSGGMCQRVVAAISTSCDPSLIIADEPTTALDVTTQAQLMTVLNHLKNTRGMGIIFITHDFGIVPQMCDRVGVMYAGTIVEMADVNDIFETPRHPYTKALMASLPRLDKDTERLATIPGQPPTLYQPPSGCVFKERCPIRKSKCDTFPPEQQLDNRRTVHCWYAS